MKKWGLFFILVSIFSFPSNSYAISSNGKVTYTPENLQQDPWKGGVVTLEDNYTVNNSDISYNPILSQTIDFKIVWVTPEGISGQQMAQSLTNHSTIEIGNQIVPIDKRLLSYSGNTITYTFNKSGFDFWALLKWLASLLFNPELTIKTRLVLDVNALSKDNEADKSVSKVVTNNKLPPNRLKRLQFSSQFYNRKQQNILNHSTELTTWNSYISPWNVQQANGEVNGKQDDTQTDGTTEVVGINRILNGENYLTRTIQVPITETINPNQYMRVINLYTKTPVTPFLQADSQVISEDIYEENAIPYFSRTTRYTFKGTDGQINLSPVQMLVHQKTFLNLTLQTFPEQLQVNQPFEVTGKVESEGTNDAYYYKIDTGNRVITENKGKNKEVKIEIEGLSEGKHQITVGVNNEYGLIKEEQFTVNVINEEVKLTSITKEINFGQHPIPKPGDQLFNQNAFSIQVIDTYLSEKNWVLSAKIEKVMQTETQSYLPADLYIEGENKEIIKLSNDFAPIFINDRRNNGLTKPIDFKPNQGLFLKMNSANVKTKEAYRGSIQFVLNLGP